MDLWGATLLPHGGSPPFANYSDLYQTIDSTELGGAPWQNFAITYQGEHPEVSAPEWMTSSYEVWFRDPHVLIKDIVANPDYKGHVDYVPTQEFDATDDRQYHNFMSGDWVWEQAVRISVFIGLFSSIHFIQNEIAQDPETHGGMFVPIILGSDKTTVSIATGDNEYYPLYASVGNVHNNIRRAHRNAVVLVGFLAIPKSLSLPFILINVSLTSVADKKHMGNSKFRKFRRQLFHSSLSIILQNFKPGMTVPEVIQCSDGHFRRAIYGLGPYIADYPEQVLLTCVMQGWCAR